MQDLGVTGAKGMRGGISSEAARRAALWLAGSPDGAYNIIIVVVLLDPGDRALSL